MLASSLSVTVEPSAADFVFEIANASDDAIVLEFASGQRFDVAVRAPDGAEVWRWSDDRSFTMMLSSHTLAAGATLRWSARWSPAASGRWVATGTLASSSHRAEASASFVVP